jgi:hypothetical protein
MHRRNNSQMKSSIGICSVIFGTIFLVSASFECGYAQQAQKDDVPPRFQHSLDLFHGGHCQEAWSELWKLAQNRDYYALYILASTVVSPPFRFLPASETDRLSAVSRAHIGTDVIEKIYFPTMIYATLTSETINFPFSIDTLRSLIPTIIAHSRDLDPIASKGVIDCFASKEPSEICVRLAIESHLIPEYDAFIATVNQINQTRLRVECETSSGERVPKSWNSKKN